MPRLSRLAWLLAVVALLGASPSATADGLADLDARGMKEMVGATRAYLDPEVEFAWKPRKVFTETITTLMGDDALGNVPLLRELVAQGRHFLPRFQDRKWRNENGVSEFDKKSGYFSLKSEKLRFTYTLPDRYPRENEFNRKVPRVAPYPLLLSIPEEQDGIDSRNEAVEHPGQAALKRRFPKAEWKSLYSKWFLLSPVAARARFLDEDGNIRHDFLTSYLTEFWRHYHVDFDRFVLDGTEAAAAFAAAFPNVFAGLVLRGGSIEPEIVRNYASVPVYVVGDEALKKALDEAGHPDVTLGDEAGLMAWLEARKRVIPRNFRWNELRADHQYANWIHLHIANFGAAERTLEVEVLDTEEHPNTIRIDAVGIERINMSLNDEIVDLDREVRLLLNGHESSLGVLERTVAQLFDKDPFVRKNMNFGHIYPVSVKGVQIPEPVEEAPPEEAAPEEPAVEGTPADEAKAKAIWDAAERAEADGERDKAITLYEKVVEVGETSLKAKAEKKIAELKEAASE